MTSSELLVERLADRHNRQDFDSGVPALDRYLREQASQDERRDVAACCVLIESSETGRVLGYYTLSAQTVRLTDLPEALARRLPRYGLVPAVLLGRLAIDRRRQGRGYRTWLLYDALGRALALRASAGVWSVLVDAIDDDAAAFYRHQEFEPLPDNPLRLFLPLRRVAQLVTR